MNKKVRVDPTLDSMSGALNQVPEGPVLGDISPEIASPNDSKEPEARVDAAPNSRSTDKPHNERLPIKLRSRTSPQIVGLFEGILLSDAFFDWRNKRLEELARVEDENKRKRMHDMLFAYERAQLDRFELIKNTPASQLRPEDRYVKEFKDPESFLASTYGNDGFRLFIQNHLSDVWVKFNEDVTRVLSESKDIPDEIIQSPTALRAYAVELQFKKKYPELERTLSDESKTAPTPEKKGYAERALQILKYGSMFFNPSGAATSYILKSIYQSSALQPYRAKVESAVTDAVKSFWTPERQKSMQWVQSDTMKKVGAGLAVTSVVCLAAVGIVNSDEAIELASNFLESASSKTVELAAAAQEQVVSAGGWWNDIVSSATESSRGFASAIPTLSDAIYQPELDNASVSEPLISGLDTSPLSVDTSPQTSVAPPEPVATQPIQSGSPVQQPAAPLDAVEPKPLQTTPVTSGSDVVVLDTPKSGGVYVVRSGDCLSKIAESMLRAEGVPYNYTTIDALYHEIAKANGIPDPNKIYPGMQLSLQLPPGVDLSAPPVHSSIAAAPVDVSKAMKATNDLIASLDLENAFAPPPTIAPEHTLSSLQSSIERPSPLPDGISVQQRDLDVIAQPVPSGSVVTYDEYGNAVSGHSYGESSASFRRR